MPELDDSVEDSDDDEAETNRARARPPPDPELMKSMETLHMESWVWNEEENLVDPTLFPFAVAEVRPYWKLVLLQRSYYWTRVVLNIDCRSPTPFEDAEEIIRFTAPRLLHVAIGHRYDIIGREEDLKLEEAGEEIHRSARSKYFTLPEYLHQYLLACFGAQICCFRSHPRPSIGLTMSSDLKGTSVTHSWCDEAPPQWRQMHA